MSAVLAYEFARRLELFFSFFPCCEAPSGTSTVCYRSSGNGLVDESVPEHRDASSSSHVKPSEPRVKVISGKRSIFTHFPKDPKLRYLLENHNS